MFSHLFWKVFEDEFKWSPFCSILLETISDPYAVIHMFFNFLHQLEHLIVSYKWEVLYLLPKTYK